VVGFTVDRKYERDGELRAVALKAAEGNRRGHVRTNEPRFKITSGLPMI
jgi:hypothetical protein